MKKILAKLSKKPDFSQRGLVGYHFSVKNKNFGISFVDVKQGHDTYIISKKCTHIYYILKGRGIFDVQGNKNKVKVGDLIEMLPGIEYTYSGKMKIILITAPRWFRGNEIITRNNTAVK